MPKCKSCGMDIKWITMKSGKAMPVDVHKETIITDEGELVRGGKSHFATCPEGATHRRPK